MFAPSYSSSPVLMCSIVIVPLYFRCTISGLFAFEVYFIHLSFLLYFSRSVPLSVFFSLRPSIYPFSNLSDLISCTLFFSVSPSSLFSLFPFLSVFSVSLLTTLSLFIVVVSLSLPFYLFSFFPSVSLPISFSACLSLLLHSCNR